MKRRRVVHSNRSAMEQAIMARDGGRRRGDHAPAAVPEGLGMAALHMPQGLCIFDADDRLVACNPRFAEIYGLDMAQLRPGMTQREMIAMRYSGAIKPSMSEADFVAWREKIGLSGRPIDTVVELSNGRIVAVHRRPVPQGWIATHEDITHRSRNEAQIAFLARHDALTGLPNRILFRERLSQAISDAENGHGVAVLYLDLDRFKSINDSLGHPVGDALLCEVAERLQACTRDMDTVARLGGDEFAIIQCGVDEKSSAALMAQRVIEAIRAPVQVDAHTILTNTSIGITMAPRDAMQANKLLKNADLALYQAKADGRGVFRFFTSEMDAALAARRQLEHELQRAVRDQEFILHYQPQYNLRSGAVSGLEALVRWNHPTRGLVQPTEFISVAEDSGLIVPLGRWALRRACADAALWPGRQRIAVNLSVAQFRDAGLRQTVIDALADSGLAPTRLELEITESILMKDDDALLDLLHEFREMGIHIAMDDFGSGYSSLAYLRRFPFTRVKIDGAFVRDMDSAPEAEAIVRAIAQLVESLGMTTTAEGVETEEQLRRLYGTACTDAQGHLFSQPVPADCVPSLLGIGGPAPLRLDALIELP